MSDDSQRPIIVKRIKKGGGGGHGGAWKIAYADFVTAMMAFFLLMWLLGSTSQGTLSGIAEYFKQPLKLSLNGGDGAGSSTSVIKGGGKDLTQTSGQVKRGDVVPEKTGTNQKNTKEQRLKEKEQLQKLQTKVTTAIQANPILTKFKNQLMIDMTSEGLRIQIVDEKNRPMFDVGSSTLKPYTKEVLHEIGKLLNDVPNRISVSGHTDASSYASGDRGYSNWELSADRANASRRELVGGGMQESKVLRTVGSGPAIPFDVSDPMSPLNRRISITVLNSDTEQGILASGSRDAAKVSPQEAASGVSVAPAKVNPESHAAPSNH